MTGRVVWCCIPLLFALTSVSAVQRLDSINDLKRIDFGRSVPEHSLVLLHWFANIIDTDYHDNLQMTFNPRNGDYGSHRFGNIESLLDRSPPGHQSYIIGNVDQTTSVSLPDYVVNPTFSSGGRNRDRIIVRVSGHRIHQVYLTQHYGSSNPGGEPWYDPDHTYEITRNLLRQIREFAMGGDDHTMQRLSNRFGSGADVSDIRLTWGRLACLVLFWRIVTQKNVFVYQNQSRRTDNWNNESTWNRGSSYNHATYTQQTSGIHPCLLLLLFLVLIVFFLFVLAAKPPHK